MPLHYVYALIEPETKQPRYIGKGIYNRAEHHWREAEAQDGLVVGVKTEDVWANDEETTPKNATSKQDWLKGLVKMGKSHADIARVIARELDERTAYTLESFLITHVLGQSSLLNVQPGHHATRFRPHGNWGHWENEDVSHDYYVYVLRDPQNAQDARNGVFYVGKGRGRRLDSHFLDASRTSGDPEDHDRLSKVRELLGRGLTPNQIGYVVARVATEHEAFRIEALLIKFVYGLASLTNQVAGHHAYTIRPKDHWPPLSGFDLPRVVNPGVRQDRSELLQLLLAEGLANPLDQMRQQLDGALSFAEYKVLDAGELGMEAPLGGTLLKVFTRRKNLQLELRPRTREQRTWMLQRMEALGALHLLRGDQVFIPPCWRGARHMTDSVPEVVTRVLLLIELASQLPVEQFSPAARQLLEYTALPLNAKPDKDREDLERHDDHDDEDDHAPHTALGTPVPRRPFGGGDAAVAITPQSATATTGLPISPVQPLLDKPVPMPNGDEEDAGIVLPTVVAFPGENPCISQLQEIANQFPDIDFDDPRARDAGEIAIERLIGAEGDDLGAILKISCRINGFGLELRGRTKARKAWLHERLTLLGCTLPRAMKPNEVVFLPTAWKRRAGMARNAAMVAHRVAQLLQIVTTTNPDDLDREVRALLHE